MASSSNPQASLQSVIQYPTPKDALLLVSSQGFMYLINENAESLLWRHELNTTVYKSHHVNTLDYVDVETDENGKVNLYRYSEDTKTKIQIDDTNVREEFYLGWETGRRRDDGNLRINRRTYSLSGNSETSVWTLNFSIYTAAYIEYTNNGWNIAWPCPVHHTFGNEDLIKFCQDRMDYTFSRGDLRGLKASDISTVSKFEVGKITFDTPLVNVGGSGKIFVGAYEGMMAAVKRSSGVGFATLHKLLVKSQRHDNISRYFGMESCENGDLLVAFELYYNDFDSICDSLTFHELTVVIRGVISGLIYLHELDLSFGNLNPKKVLISDEQIPKFRHPY